MDNPAGKDDTAKTLRQEMVAVLEEGPATAKDLSQKVKIQEKLVYDHLSHIDRSVKAKGQKLIIHPAQCSSCSYVFSDRKKFSKPGRCPECKRSHILAPTYQVMKK